ncbi:MAG: NAD(P)-dependent oxidoreductase [Gemmatimonadota bacterium]
MRILVTGAAGCLGRAVRRLAAGKHEIVGVDVAPRGDGQVRGGTFTDLGLMRELMAGCDAVIHAAALHGGHSETHTPLQYTQTNVLGLQGMLELGVELGVRRFVFSSTMEVVIGRRWESSGLAVVDEDTPANPDWIYPLNKLQCELLGRHYQRFHGVAFTALRYMWFQDKPGLNPHLLARYLMPDDVARANLLAAERNERDFHLLHIGPETPLTNADIARAVTDPGAVAEQYWPGSGAVLARAGVTLGPQHFWPVTRIDRARVVLGWRPQVTFADYLRSLGWRGRG